MFVSGKPFQSGLKSPKRLLASPAKIRWKGFPGTNTLAYFAPLSVTKKNSVLWSCHQEAVVLRVMLEEAEVPILREVADLLFLVSMLLNFFLSLSLGPYSQYIIFFVTFERAQ